MSNLKDILAIAAALAVILAMLTQGNLLGRKSSVKRALQTPTRVLMGDWRKRTAR